MLKIFGKWANEKILNPFAQEDIKNEKKEASNELTDEKIAAITMAMHYYFNSYRDEESEVITIDMPSAHYSPWAQKNLVMKKVVRKW